MMTPQEAKEMETMFRGIIEEVLPTAELKILAERQTQVLELVNKHNVTLYGNGKEGLTTTVSRLDRWVTGAQKVLDNILNWVLIAVLGGGSIYLLVLAAQHSLIK